MTGVLPGPGILRPQPAVHGWALSQDSYGSMYRDGTKARAREHNMQSGVNTQWHNNVNVHNGALSKPVRANDNHEGLAVKAPYG